MEARGADIDALGGDGFFGQHLLQSQQDGFFPRDLLRTLQAERPDDKVLELQTTGFMGFKLRELEASRPEINGQK